MFSGSLSIHGSEQPPLARCPYRMLSYSIGAIIEHGFSYCQGEDVAGAVHRRGRGERRDKSKRGDVFSVENEEWKGAVAVPRIE